MARKNLTVHLEGAEELTRQLDELGDRATGLALREAAEVGANVIADETRRQAPVKTGALRDSIRAATRRTQQGRAIVEIGYGRKQWYGRIVEQGSKYAEPQSFIRKAFEMSREDAARAVEHYLRRLLLR